MITNRFFSLVLAIAVAFVSSGALKAQHPLSLTPGLSWNADSLSFFTECDSAVVLRVYLVDNLQEPVNLDSVVMGGSDLPEFTIVRNQLNYLPLQDHLPWIMKDEDSIWIEIKFKPDLTKGYAFRHAFVLASGIGQNAKAYADTVWLNGVVRQADLAGPINYDFGIRGFGSFSDTVLQLRNRGDTDFVIAKFNLRVGEDFKITFGPKLGDRVKPGDWVVAHIEYSPSAANGRSFDTLVVEGLHPLRESLSIPLSGFSAGAFVSNDPKDLETEAITVFPNPASDGTTISANARQMSVEVFDVLGRLVARSPSLDPLWKWDCTIAGRYAPDGSYLLRINGIGDNGDSFSSSARLLIDR